MDSNPMVQSYPNILDKTRFTTSAVIKNIRDISMVSTCIVKRF